MLTQPPGADVVTGADAAAGEAPLRLFVGLRVSPAARAPLAHLMRRLAREDDALRMPAEEDLHLTLQFLGAVPRARVPALAAALAEVARRHAPLPVRYRSLGAFPAADRPRVLWAGVEPAPPDALERLARDVGAALRPLGFPPEARPFHAHVTLARVREGRRPAPETRERLRALAPDAPQAADLGADRLSDLKLIVSAVGAARYAYNDLTSHPLAAGA